MGNFWELWGQLWLMYRELWGIMGKYGVLWGIMGIYVRVSADASVFFIPFVLIPVQIFMLSIMPCTFVCHIRTNPPVSTCRTVIWLGS